MSHYVVAVLTPRKLTADKEAERILEQALAPFDENTEVAPHIVDCYCLGSITRKRINEEVTAKYGTWDEHREKYHALSEAERKAVPWEKFTEKLRKCADMLTKKYAKGMKQPDPKCDDCKGIGRRETTYNPKSKWDWWSLGGRWSCYYSSYEAEKDPANFKPCDLCKGTGIRDGWAKKNPKTGKRVYKDAWAKKMKGCNVCLGTGKELKDSTQWNKRPHDFMSMEEFLSGVKKRGVPFAVLTDDGEWHERGRMGWWASVSNEKADKKWNSEVRALLKRYPDHTVIIADLHI